MEALREIFARYEIAVNDTKLDTANDKIGSVIKNLGKLAEVAATYIAIKWTSDFIQDQIAMGVELENNAKRLGMSTDELQKWQFAAGMTGQSADTAVRAIGILNRTLGQAEMGNKSFIKVYQQLGIDLKNSDGSFKSASEVAGDLADKLHNTTSQAERTALITRTMGRGAVAMLPLFEQGSQAIHEMFEEYEQLGGGIRRDFIEAAKHSNEELVKLKLSFDNLKSRIALALLPVWDRLVEGFTSASRWLIQLSDHTYFLETAMWGIAAVAAIMLAPLLIDLGALLIAMLPVIIAAGLIYLAFDDVYTMIRGGHSVLGDFIDSMYGVGSTSKLVDTLKQAWKDLLPSIAGAGRIAADVGKIIVNALFAAGGAIATLAAALDDLVMNKGKGVPDILKNGAKNWNTRSEAIAQNFSDIGTDFMDAADPYRNKVVTAYDVPTQRDMAEGRGGSQKQQKAAATALHVTQTNRHTINVMGAHDPKATAAAVGDVLKSQTSDDMQAAFMALGNFADSSGTLGGSEE